MTSVLNILVNQVGLMPFSLMSAGSLMVMTSSVIKGEDGEIIKISPFLPLGILTIILGFYELVSKIWF